MYSVFSDGKGSEGRGVEWRVLTSRDEDRRAAASFWWSLPRDFTFFDDVRADKGTATAKRRGENIDVDQFKTP